MNGREEAGAEVVVEVFILTHLKHLLPLLYRHLFLDTLRCLLLIPDFFTAKLQTETSH